MTDYHAPYEPHIAAIAITILVLLLGLFMLTLFLLLRGEEKRLPVHQLAANAILSHLLLSIFLHAASIHLYLLYRAVSKTFCWLYRHLFTVYFFLTPYMLFMFTVERLIYISNPTAYAQKLGRVAMICMLAIPWVTSIAFTLAAIHSVGVDVQVEYPSGAIWDYNRTRNVCIMKLDSYVGTTISLGIFGAVIPLLTCLVITVVVLVMWCCYKKRISRGTNYAMMGQEVETTVRDSVIAVALLNFIYIVMFIIEMAVLMYLPLKQGIFTLFGAIEAVIFMGTLGTVRAKIVGYARWCRARGRGRGSVQYVAKEEDQLDL